MKIDLHYKQRLEVHIKAQLRLHLWYQSQSMRPIAVGNEAVERAIEQWKAEIKEDYESGRSHAPLELELEKNEQIASLGPVMDQRQIGRAHV